MTSPANHFVLQHFDDLLATPEEVEQFGQTILQLAVQGKLLPQNPQDEPASELLKRIKTEKERLIEGGKIPERDPLPPIRENEKPFELPKGWEWARLGELSQNIHYGYTASADFASTEYRLLRITDIQNSKVDWNSVPGCDISQNDAGKYLLCEDDILIARTGGTIGKSYLESILKLSFGR
jgi:type I restriction enzyme S subunit